MRFTKYSMGATFDVLLGICAGREKRLFGDGVWAGIWCVRVGGVPGQPAVRGAPQPTRAQAAVQWRYPYDRHLRHTLRVTCRNHLYLHDKIILDLP